MYSMYNCKHHTPKQTQKLPVRIHERVIRSGLKTFSEIIFDLLIVIMDDFRTLKQHAMWDGMHSNAT
jgi:hypothetical protein